MADSLIQINQLKIATPCPAKWEDMKGDERSRFCELCKLNVYNFEGMRSSEIQELIANREGRICARMLRRADGTVVTKDCPVGVRLRRRVRMLAGSIAACLGLGFLVAGIRETEAQNSERGEIEYLAGGIALPATPVASATISATKTPGHPVTIGKIAPPHKLTLGEIAPMPTSTPAARMGDVYVPPSASREKK